MMEEILKAENLSKIYYDPTPNEVLKNISLTVKKRETVAIMGPSGVGKSTLLHILGTIDSPSHGSLIISGKDALTGDIPLIRNEHIGFIFQNFNLLEEYSVLENILMPAKIGRKKVGKGSMIMERALKLLELVNISDHACYLAKQLSGGEKQRIAIARALLNDPDLILADEPSGNLDDTHSYIIHDLLIGSAKEFGKALIVVTHNQELANLCDCIYHLNKGHLI
jgi:lipoprotein-releasing system ATP-binding protein